MTAFLSLGSNLGDRRSNLEQAITLLNNPPGLVINNISSYYETEPWGGIKQDPFLNLVLEIESQIDPLELLKHCQQVEETMGRIRSIHWGPRIIDIDILTYNNMVINKEELIIPHPYMEEREFVLAPLREIKPDFILPSGQSVLEVKGQGKVKKISFT